MPDTSTEVAIASQTLGSAASTITFSSIPSTYTDLRVVFTGSGTSGFYAMRFNGNSSSFYSVTFLVGNGSAAESGNNSSNPYFYLGYNDALSSNMCMYTHDIFSYAGSTFKTMLTTESYDKNGSGEVNRTVGLWRSTAAVTSITIMNTAGTDFLTGSTATLYGIL